MTEQENQVLTELLMKVSSIHQGFYGVPGTDDKGLIGQFKQHCEEGDKREIRLSLVEAGMKNNPEFSNKQKAAIGTTWASGLVAVAMAIWQAISKSNGN